LEAINVMVEDDFVGKSRALEALVRQKGQALAAKYPGQIEQLRGAGALHGIFLTQQESLLQNLLARLPVKMLQDKRFIAKITVASVVDWLYKKHNIFTFFNNNRDVGVLFSPALVITPEETNLFFEALDATLDHGLFKVTAEFFKSKIIKTIT
jgi:putrescine aminotransferase